MVHALLHRTYKIPFASPAEVPSSLRTELAGICKVCFSDDNVSKHGHGVSQYREQFLADLNPTEPGFPTTLGDLAARLKAWRNTLLATVEDSMPPVLRLEEESRTLQVYCFILFYLGPYQFRPRHTYAPDTDPLCPPHRRSSAGRTWKCRDSTCVARRSRPIVSSMWSVWARTLPLSGAMALLPAASPSMAQTAKSDILWYRAVSNGATLAVSASLCLTKNGSNSSLPLTLARWCSLGR